MIWCHNFTLLYVIFASIGEPPMDGKMSLMIRKTAALIGIERAYSSTADRIQQIKIRRDIRVEKTEMHVRKLTMLREARHSLHICFHRFKRFQFHYTSKFTFLEFQTLKFKRVVKKRIWQSIAPDIPYLSL